MIKNRKLDHVGLPSVDVELTAKWYMDVLGYKLIGTFILPGDVKVMFIENVEGFVYEIYPAEIGANPEALGKIEHFCFVSDDIEKDYAYCVEQEYEIVTDGIESIPQFWDNGVRFFKIASPTGEAVEFCQKV